MKCTQKIRDYFSNDQSDEESSESEMEYPLTPPPSDHSGSRPISPEHGLSHDLNTNIIHIAERQTFSGMRIQAEGSKQLRRMSLDFSPSAELRALLYCKIIGIVPQRS